MSNVNISKSLRTIFFITGCAFFYIMCQKIGWGVILQSLYHISWYGLVIIMIYPLAWRILHSIAFYILSHIPKSKWRHFLEAQITSIAVGDIFPVGALGGEIYRVLYLNKKYKNYNSKLFASLILYNTFYGVAVVIFLITTIVYLVFSMDLDSIFINIICYIIGIFGALLVLILSLQRYGMFSVILNIFGKIKWLKNPIQRVITKIIEVDTIMKGYIVKHPYRFIIASLLLFASRFCGIGEVLLIGYFMGHPFTVPQAVLLVIVDTCVQTFLFFAPGGQLGFMEGAINGAALIINKPMSVTMSLSIFKRLRSLFWDFVGLVLIYFSGNSLLKETKKEIEK